MNVAQKFLILLKNEDKVLLCKQKDAQLWGGILVDKKRKNSKEDMKWVDKYLRERFGLSPQKLTESATVYRHKFCCGQPVNEILSVVVAENVEGLPNNPQYDFEWTDISQIAAKPLEAGDYYWLPQVFRGTNMCVSMRYDKTNTLITFDSTPKVVDFSLNVDGRTKN